MAGTRKTKAIAEYGDFQTPADLAIQVCALLARQRERPAAILEPTCGIGNFIFAAADAFPAAQPVIGVEINPTYVTVARERAANLRLSARVQVREGDFFAFPWPEVLPELPDPLLVIGNLPWVTNSTLGGLGSNNLPDKRNHGAQRGIVALTGKSNFDISEWMLQQMLHWMEGRLATIAVLCKTAVARKVLAYAWSQDLAIGGAAIYHIDAVRHFGATVDACLFVLRTAPSGVQPTCHVFSSLDAAQPEHEIGMRNGRLVANIAAYERWQHLDGVSPLQWRSGIKHDCTRVMELRLVHQRLFNGLDECVEIESDFVYPMLKSSQLTKDTYSIEHRFMVVPQRTIGEDTRALQQRAPSTWRYLAAHGDLLDRRASRIYRTQPRFAIFGVGAYAFAPWKVVISGFYKQLDFRVIGPHAGKPVVLDDTCYFLPCQVEAEARRLAYLLNSAPAQEFFNALIFWDAKRPITAEILGRLDLRKLADELDLPASERSLFLETAGVTDPPPGNAIQGALFGEPESNS